MNMPLTADRTSFAVIPSVTCSLLPLSSSRILHVSYCIGLRSGYIGFLLQFDNLFCPVVSNLQTTLRHVITTEASPVHFVLFSP